MTSFGSFSVGVLQSSVLDSLRLPTIGSVLLPDGKDTLPQASLLVNTLMKHEAEPGVHLSLWGESLQRRRTPFIPVAGANLAFARSTG